MPHLRAAGQRLEYEWLGPGPEAGPALVFLHEGLGSVSLWRDFPARLVAATGHGALVYSRRGYGSSATLAEPRRVDFMHEEARILTAVLAAASVERAILVGHSDGASIGLLYAAQRPPGLLGLVVEAPHVFVEEVTLTAARAATDAWHRGDLRRSLRRHHGANTEGAFLGWSGIWLDPEFRSWCIEDCLDRIECPVLTIQGTADPYGTTVHVERIAERVRGPVEQLLLEGVGHSPHRDAADRCLAAMERFVRRCGE